MLCGVELVDHPTLVENYYRWQTDDPKICVECWMFKGIQRSDLTTKALATIRWSQLISKFTLMSRKFLAKLFQ